MSDYVSAEEAAQRCGVSSKTVRRWVASGRLKADKIGRSFRIAVNDLDQVSGHSDPASGPILDTGQDIPPASSELVRLVRDQQQTIMELSGRLGFLQSELQQRDAVILALQAPKVVQESDELETASESQQRAPWWRRLMFG